MKNPYQHIKDNPHHCKRLFGIPYDDWCELIKLMVADQAATKTAAEQRKRRINAPGGGCPPRLTPAEQVSLCLFYLRQHPTFQVLGLLYGVSESSAHALYHAWMPVLRPALPSSWLEEVAADPERLAQRQQILADYELLVDSTEQPCERPGDYNEQKAYYSGKKKQHTFKNQLVSFATGDDIADVLVGEMGPRSDQSLLREQQSHFQVSQKFIGDKGYQGVERTRTPQKKPRNGDLSSEAKADNRELSQDRIDIEHLIRVVKIWRIAQERFRLSKRHYQTAILVVCGLVRLRLGRLQLSG